MIIVVGTHYDQLSEKKRKDIKNLARNINSRFQTNAGYPIIACIHAISNFDREHIDSLKVDIYKHAFNVEYFGPPSQQTLFPNKIKFLGRQVCFWLSFLILKCALICYYFSVAVKGIVQ